MNTTKSFTHEVFRDFMFSLTTPNTYMPKLIKKLKVKYQLKIAVVSNDATGNCTIFKL